jgi:signal transduction histidine kinase
LNEAKACLADHAIPLALATNNSEWLSTLYDSYSDVLSVGGDYKLAIAYEKKSVATGIEASKKAAASQVRLLSAMLDLKNKEAMIQSENVEIEEHINREKVYRLWFALSASGLVLLVILLILARLQSKLKFQKQKTESARRILEIEENEKRKLSMDLHDLSGQIRMELLDQFNRINIPEGMEKTEMSSKINALSNHIRTISHRLSKITITEYDIGTLITGLCNEFREFSDLNIHLALSDSIPALSDEAKLHLFRILQEILANAAKSAKDARIKIDITGSSTHFTMIYSDNGKGFDTGTVKTEGLGLKNIQERAKILGGTAELDSAPGMGTFWEIRIPLNLNRKLNQV